ncbi:hypothetical protein EsVE80_17880 [Enterococcus saigonensis]|uniref:KAP NTPase domain-containing protein n=1 Tax=Enterococcus saigonensis TaxID=1805431 RepID=A0A679IL27_9ENTE|nr:P-loop NTPase fold protein [Enterococcus saigonensis]BCA86265.1 hypothetical protein EsVE80_17880 [Enterococcus saigonensis]
MDTLIQIIKNYIEEEGQYALQIDGKWGTGKTYFIKNSVIDNLKKENYYPIYFSVYGYNNLVELKQDLFAKILSELSQNKTMFKSLTRISKKFKNVSSVLGDVKLSSVSLVSDWILDAYGYSKMEKTKDQAIVIFIDDLERVSNEVNLKDLLGFILNELLEKLRCKVVILSNSSEIEESTDFKRIKEKVINRTIKFSYDASKIEEMILKKNRNNFIQENSSWIKTLVETYQNSDESPSINLRTLFSIIENYDFIESKLLECINELKQDDLKSRIRKSLFLNIFVVTREYKLGNITEKNLATLKKLDDTRYFDYYLSKDDSRSIREDIIDKYHKKIKIFDDDIFYSYDVSSYILLGYFDNSDYVLNWNKVFFPMSKEISQLDKLNDFRRLTDIQLREIQRKLIEDVRDDKFDFEDLITVYGRFFQFEKIGLVLIDEDYIELFKEKLIYRYSQEEKPYIDLVDKFFIRGVPNIKTEQPDLYQSLKDIDNERRKDSVNEFLEGLFANDLKNLSDLLQSGILLKNNIFEIILHQGFVDRYIVTTNNTADLFWQLIRSEYLRISNVKELHKNELNDIKLLLTEIKTKVGETELGRIDYFKIKQLIESLEELKEMLE